MKKILLTYFLLLSTLSFAEIKTIYTVQVASYTEFEQNKARQTCDKFIKQGYFSYFYYTEEVKIKNDSSTRIRTNVGLYTNQEEAKKFAEELKLKKLLTDYVIAKNYLFVQKNQSMEIISTGSGIWLFDKNKYSEIFRFEKDIMKGTINQSTARLTRNKEALTLTIAGKVYLIELKTNKSSVIENNDYCLSNKKSNDGLYIAFIDPKPEFEEPSYLYIKKSSGKEKQKLTNVDSTSVMCFAWHSKTELIFFSWYLNIFGGCDQGAELYTTDIRGNRKKIIDKKIYKDFYIYDGILYYSELETPDCTRKFTPNELDISMLKQ